MPARPEVGRVVHYLKATVNTLPQKTLMTGALQQTARLSDFLMKLSDINAKKSEVFSRCQCKERSNVLIDKVSLGQVPHSLAKKDQRMNNLAKLQADEEKITE